MHSQLFVYLCLCSTSSELAVEEDVGYIELEIRRADGTFGEISVDLHTVAGSAVSPTGMPEKTSMIATHNHQYFVCFLQVTVYLSV